MLSDIFIVETTQHPPRSTVQSEKVETMRAGLSTRPDDTIIIFQGSYVQPSMPFKQLVNCIVHKTKRDKVKIISKF